MKGNQIVLHITHQFTRRLAYDLLFNKPASFRKKALVKYEEKRSDFFWLVRKMDKGWFDTVPEGYVVNLNYSEYKRGFLPMFYLCCVKEGK